MSPQPKPEVELLLACARLDLDDAAPGRMSRLVGDGVNWDVVLAMAASHKLTGLLHRHLARLSEDCIPRAIVECLQRRVRDSALNGLALDMHLRRLAGALNREQVGFACLKGPALAHGIYREPALREFLDLDILVRPADVQRALICFGGLGFRPAQALAPGHGLRFHGWYRECVLTHSDGTVVDLHWSLTPAIHPAQLDGEGFCSRLITVNVDGVEIPAPGPEDLLLYLAVHGGKHLWSTLIWVCDVAELLRSKPDLDWTLVVHRARRTGSERMLLVALELARSLLDASHPLEVPPGVDALVERLTHRILTTSEKKPGLLSELLLHTRMTPYLGPRLRYWLGTLTMPTEAEWEALRLPPRLFPLYYLIRPVRLALKHALWRAPIGS